MLVAQSDADDGEAPVVMPADPPRWAAVRCGGGAPKHEPGGDGVRRAVRLAQLRRAWLGLGLELGLGLGLGL